MFSRGFYFATCVLACLYFALYFGLRLATFKRHSYTLGDATAAYSRHSGDYDGSFFFVEISGTACLNFMQVCAVESAATHHPDMKVVLLTRSPVGNAKMGLHYNTHYCRYALPLDELPNVVVLRVDQLDDIFSESPLNAWYKRGVWKQSPHEIVHLSDAVRLVLLWRHGGIYSDGDVVVRRPMTALRNCIGYEGRTKKEIITNNGVQVLDKHHPILKILMEDMSREYNAASYTHCNTHGFARVLLKYYYCVERISAEFAPSNESYCIPSKDENKGNNKSIGSSLTVHPADAFHPIYCLKWSDYWDPSVANKTLQEVRHSYIIHLWGNMHRHKTGPPETGSAYAHEARQHCPRVYSAHTHPAPA